MGRQAMSVPCRQVFCASNGSVYGVECYRVKGRRAEGIGYQNGDTVFIDSRFQAVIGDDVLVDVPHIGLGFARLLEDTDGLYLWGGNPDRKFRLQGNYEILGVATMTGRPR